MGTGFRTDKIREREDLRVETQGPATPARGGVDTMRVSRMDRLVCTPCVRFCILAQRNVPFVGSFSQDCSESWNEANS